PAPTVPPDVEDLSADPTLAAVAPPPAATAPAPPAAAETPEMTRLRALLAQPEPPLTDTGPTRGQQAAYGCMAGRRGAGAAEPLISGQRAEAVQRQVMERQQRETTVNNLIRLVTLQQQEAARQTELKQKQVDLVIEAQKIAGSVNQLHQDS